MNIEVSVGEAIDKLSILELKMKKICDKNKKTEVQKEINALNACHKYKEYYLYYNLLMYVNEQIWDMTDVIKGITIADSRFAPLSNQIFEFNQKRFRVKNWFNLITRSNIKEQKSYSPSRCEISVGSEDIFYNKISEIIFLSLEYDVVTIVSNFNDKIKNIFHIPTITYSTFNDINHATSILLENFEIPDKNLRHIFEFKPIAYISGGLLGDFVHQLSTINENFLRTGRKGILYMANIGDAFRFGLPRTYEDMVPIVSKQNYIKTYSIYNDEKYDVDLSAWRQSKLLFKTSWDNIFLNTYNVEWGSHKWINVPVDNKWKDSILISTNSYRPTYNIDYKQLFETHGKNLKFVMLDLNEYNWFKVNYNIHNVDAYSPLSIYEMCIAINSCKLFIGNFSLPLAFAYAMHKKTVAGMSERDEIHQLGLDKVIPNVMHIFDKNGTTEKIKQLCSSEEH
jgi:hypothetical protein